MITLFQRRIGLLGGTFNPVHIGHLRPALTVAELLGLTRVDLMPAPCPPHKAGSSILPFAMRVRLLHAATGMEPLLGVCEIEETLPEPSYTWKTAAAWAERYGRRPLFLIGDADFAQWDTWQHGLELFDIMDAVVMPRSGTDDLFRETVARFWPGTGLHDEPGVAGAISAAIGRGRCLYLPIPIIELSATDIRGKWLRGESLRYLTPDPVIRTLDEDAAEIRPIWERD